MKKLASAILVCVMLLSCLLTLASCSRSLSGTYENTSFAVTTSYKFEAKKVSISYSLGGFSYTYDGEYEIKDNDEGKTVIVFTFGDDGAAKYEGEFDFAQGTEDGKPYIKIGGTQYTKVN